MHLIRYMMHKSICQRTSGVISLLPLVHKRSILTDPDGRFFAHLKSKIKFSGPLTVQEYMKEVLTNPLSGYYMKRDVFGAKGDYITSPEISQMFGELIGVWIFHEWYKMGSVTPLQLVEFGPGRGTLMADILRTLLKFATKTEKFSLHFVEKSPFMASLQEEKICGTKSETLDIPEKATYYKRSVTKDGSPVYWYTHLQGVPQRFSFFIANEFFDSLPIHKFRKTDSGWREVLIDILPEEDNLLQPQKEFRYVLSPSPTPASTAFVKKDEPRSEIEVCPEAGAIAAEMAQRVRSFGGTALIIDYGHDGSSEDTFRAFRKHKAVSPLIDPGEADLTADVDFSYIRKHVENNVICFGPTTQCFFLKNMGIDLRLQSMLTKVNTEQQKNLISNYKMLTDPDQMGERFKVFGLFPRVLKDFYENNPPAGFFEDSDERNSLA